MWLAPRAHANLLNGAVILDLPFWGRDRVWIFFFFFFFFLLAASSGVALRKQVMWVNPNSLSDWKMYWWFICVITQALLPLLVTAVDISLLLLWGGFCCCCCCCCFFLGGGGCWFDFFGGSGFWVFFSHLAYLSKVDWWRQNGFTNKRCMLTTRVFVHFQSGFERTANRHGKTERKGVQRLVMYGIFVTSRTKITYVSDIKTVCSSLIAVGDEITLKIILCFTLLFFFFYLCVYFLLFDTWLVPVVLL